MTAPLLHVLAGPHGSGKSTFVAGYLVELHVMLVPEELAVRRVAVYQPGQPETPPAWPAWTPPELLAALRRP